MLQCVAERCSELQCVAGCCMMLQCVAAACCSVIPDSSRLRRDLCIRMYHMTNSRSSVTGCMSVTRVCESCHPHGEYIEYQ